MLGHMPTCSAEFCHCCSNSVVDWNPAAKQNSKIGGRVGEKKKVIVGEVLEPETCEFIGYDGMPVAVLVSRLSGYCTNVFIYFLTPKARQVADFSIANSIPAFFQKPWLLFCGWRQSCSPCKRFPSTVLSPDLECTF